MNNAICSNMDGPRDFHTKWSKSDRERQISYDIAYMGNLILKMIQVNLFTKQKQTYRYQKTNLWASLVAQRLRIHLPRQETRVWALVWEYPTCHGATKCLRHNYWACALEPVSHTYWARVPQLLKPAHLEPILCNEKPQQWEANAPQRRVVPACCN